MASTGAFRQVLQQVFAIPIEEENSSNTPPITNGNQNNDNGEEDSITTFYEFADDTENNTKEIPSKNISDYTEEDIDAEFSNF